MKHFLLLLILLTALSLTALAPAFAQNAPHRSTPPNQSTPTGQRAQNWDDLEAAMAEEEGARPLEWAISSVLIIGVTALAWAGIALLMWWPSGEKPGKTDLLLVGGGVLFMVAFRVAVYFMPDNFLVLLENPNLRTLSIYFRALGGAYFAVLAMLFFTSLGYGIRRAITKKTMDKGGVIWWGLFYSALLLGFMGTSGAVPGRALFLGLAAGYFLLWLWRNPWMIIAQIGEYHKSKGNIQKGIDLRDRVLSKPRISDKTRFALMSDNASAYNSLGEWHKAIETVREGLPLASSFQSVEVLIRSNLLEAHLYLEQLPAAVEQAAEIFRLTNTVSCFGGVGMWKGAGHGLLASINLRRGWFDEAAKQAELCLEKFPPEAEKGPTPRSLVAVAKSVQAGLHLANQQPKAAARLCRQALKRNPRYCSVAHIRTLYASALLADEKLDEAEAQCRQALAACAKWPAAYFWLGHIQRAQGKTEDARQSFEAAVAVYPEHPYAERARRALGFPASPAVRAPVVETSLAQELEFDLEMPPESVYAGATA